uniref:Serpin domain-containing protein n=1 Tax=Panagrolaimus davidi TaxID=227884 RepID=A0A914QPP7_9BILA
MTLFGAKGTTAIEISNVIGEVNQDYPKNEEDDEEGQNTKVLFANKFFVSNTTELIPEFSNLMQQKFNSDVQSLDFKTSEAVEKINFFVKKVTQGKIKKIISTEEISPKTSVILINALHFSGSWLEKFDKRRPELFKSLPPRQIDMIEKLQNEWNYNEGNDWQALGIPYKNKMAYMYIVLPKNEDGLQSLLQKMDYSIFKECTKSKMRDQITVSIPCFEISQEFELQEILKKIGITEIFTTKCNLSGMLKDQNQKLDSVIHKATINVDENGTEASAATEFNFAACCKKLIFKADHPFLYFITLNETFGEKKIKEVKVKKVLFMGIYC